MTIGGQSVAVNAYGIPAPAVSYDGSSRGSGARAEVGMRTQFVPAALALALTLLAPPASAAVLRCAPPVLGDVVEAPTELAARKAAIASWTKKIAPHGDRFPSWRLARNKRYQRGKLASGAWTCAAFAAPCTIRQKPPSAKPQPPQKPGQAI